MAAIPQSTSFPKWMATVPLLTILCSCSTPANEAPNPIEFFDGMAGVVFNDSIFLAWNPTQLPWLEAKNKCREVGGALASIKTRAFNRFVFQSFFQQTVLQTPAWERKGEYSSERRTPPTRTGLMRGFHKYEAWVNGVKTLKTTDGYEWYWVGASPFTFTQFGTGFTDDARWNCLSVKPGYSKNRIVYDSNNPEAQVYDLYWYGSNCRTRLPFICQFVATKRARSDIRTPTAEGNHNRRRRPPNRITSHGRRLSSGKREWSDVKYYALTFVVVIFHNHCYYYYYCALDAWT